MRSRISKEEGCEPRSRRGFGKRTLAALNEAYAATLHYYGTLSGDGDRNPKIESVLASLWRQVGRLLRDYDPALATRLTARPQFWLQDATWSPATIRKAWAGLNSIRVSANIMDPDRTTVQAWSIRFQVM